LPDADGEILVKVLQEQDRRRQKYPLSPRDLQQLARSQMVRGADRSVLVEVPEREPAEVPEQQAVQEGADQDTYRQSLKVQAVLARIGAEMGFRIWVPRNDRQSVLQQVPAATHEAFLSQLPLNYDDVTLKTIEQIDVIWLRNRSMARAFEVEHTTAIYSGLLRMADLLALQPNMNIR
jgi:hypothetical protein